MFEKYINVLTQSLDTLGQGNILALAVLFFVLALGEWGIPFPLVLQSVLFYLGYQISHGSYYMLFLVLILISGRLAGSAVLFWSARTIGNPLAEWFNKRFRKIHNKLDKLKNNLGNKSPFAIAIARLTPGLLVPTSLASGALKLRYLYFASGVVLSSLIWDSMFVVSGIILGQGAKSLNNNISIWLVPAGFFTTIFMIWGIQRLISRRKSCAQAVKYEK